MSNDSKMTSIWTPGPKDDSEFNERCAKAYAELLDSRIASPAIDALNSLADVLFPTTNNDRDKDPVMELTDFLNTSILDCLKDRDVRLPLTEIRDDDCKLAYPRSIKALNVTTDTVQAMEISELKGTAVDLSQIVSNQFDTDTIFRRVDDQMGDFNSEPKRFPPVDPDRGLSMELTESSHMSILNHLREWDRIYTARMAPKDTVLVDQVAQPSLSLEDIKRHIHNDDVRYMYPDTVKAADIMAGVGGDTAVSSPDIEQVVSDLCEQRKANRLNNPTPSSAELDRQQAKPFADSNRDYGSFARRQPTCKGGFLLPPGAFNSPVDLADWIQRAGLEFTFEGHPDFPNTQEDRGMNSKYHELLFDLFNRWINVETCSRHKPFQGAVISEITALIEAVEGISIESASVTTWVETAITALKHHLPDQTPKTDLVFEFTSETWEDVKKNLEKAAEPTLDEVIAASKERTMAKLGGVIEMPITIRRGTGPVTTENVIRGLDGDFDGNVGTSDPGAADRYSIHLSPKTEGDEAACRVVVVDKTSPLAHQLSQSQTINRLARGRTSVITMVDESPLVPLDCGNCSADSPAVWGGSGATVETKVTDQMAFMLAKGVDINYPIGLCERNKRDYTHAHVTLPNDLQGDAGQINDIYKSLVDDQIQGILSGDIEIPESRPTVDPDEDDFSIDFDD